MCKRELEFLSACAFILSMFVACEKTLELVIEPVEEDNTETVNSEDFENSVVNALANNCADH